MGDAESLFTRRERWCSRRIFIRASAAQFAQGAAQFARSLTYLRRPNLLRALIATPASPVPSSSKVVGSGIVAEPRMTVFGVKPVNVTVKVTTGAMPIPVGPLKKSMPLKFGRPVKTSVVFTETKVSKKGRPFPVQGAG